MAKAKEEKTKRVILVADDEPNMLMAISYVLEASGFRVLVASNGKAAWEKLNELNAAGVTVDLLITDILMFEMGGLELIERFRQACPGKPVLVITGFGSQMLKNKLISSENTMYLEKPFRPGTLLENVATILGQPIAINGFGGGV